MIKDIGLKDNYVTDAIFGETGIRCGFVAREADDGVEGVRGQVLDEGVLCAGGRHVTLAGEMSDVAWMGGLLTPRPREAPVTT